MMGATLSGQPTPETAKPTNYFIGALIDAFAPLVTYYVFHALGVSSMVSMVLGGLVALITTLVQTIRRKRLDGFGVLVLVEIAAAALLMRWVGDARLLMVKPSVFSAIGAAYLAFTAFGDRPLTYTGSRQMATRGEPQRIAAYERVWQESTAFRTLHRTATLGWAVAFLADAVLRTVIVYGFPVERAIWLSNVPHLAAMILLVGFSALVGRKVKPLVEAQIEKLAKEEREMSAV